MKPFQFFQKALCLTSLTFVIGACSSKPILPDVKSVKVAREPADERCKELGIVYGKTLSTTGKLEELALNDLTENAAKKGANYVFLQEYGGLGSSVKGVAYDCP
jgi:hypothetical protein